MGFSEQIYRRGDVGMSGYHIAAKNLHTWAKWHAPSCGFFLPSRENHCTLGPFCARNPSIRGLFSPFESSPRGLPTLFWAQNSPSDDSVMCLIAHQNRVRRRHFPMQINGCLPGRKCLHPGLQTFATALANVCVQHRNRPKTCFKWLKNQQLKGRNPVHFRLRTVNRMSEKAISAIFRTDFCPFQHRAKAYRAPLGRFWRILGEWGKYFL